MGKTLGLLKNKGMERYVDLGVLLFLLLFPLIFSPFRTELMGKFIVFIIFALSLDLLWGYTGLMSMGHAVLFGLGGYTLAISYSMEKAGGVPDFMARFGITEIPALFLPLTNTGTAFLLGLLLPGLLAGLIGYFIFSSKVSGVFFSLITLALAQIFEVFIANQQRYTNGFNGIGSLPRKILFDRTLSLNQVYYGVLIIAVLVYFLCLWLVSGRFGKVLQSIRENESRLKFLGYKPSSYKIAIYVISGMLAGLAGMLYLPMNAFISPGDTGLTFSTAVLVWVAVGGRGNLTGAIVGTLVINWLQVLLSEAISDYWLLVLGIIVLVIVYFVPPGIIGKLKEWQYNTRIAKTAFRQKEGGN